jgi:hypothetical protein
VRATRLPALVYVYAARASFRSGCGVAGTACEVFDARIALSFSTARLTPSGMKALPPIQ